MKYYLENVSLKLEQARRHTTLLNQPIYIQVPQPRCVHRKCNPALALALCSPYHDLAKANSGQQIRRRIFII